MHGMAEGIADTKGPTLPAAGEIVIKPDSLQDPAATPKVNGVSPVVKEEVPPGAPQLEVMKGDTTEEMEVAKLSSTSVVESKEELKQEPESTEKPESTEPQDLTVTCTSTFEPASVKPVATVTQKPYQGSKVISISVEQCQMNHSQGSRKDEDVDKVQKPRPITNRKRSTKSTDSEDSGRVKYRRGRVHVQDGDSEREDLVSEFVEKASGSSLDDLQRNSEKLQQEIHSLSALARAKELEWNDIIRLKKVKEEMYLRLLRRKQVMLLSMGVVDNSRWDFSSENRMADFFTNDEVSYNRVAPSVSPKPTPRIPSNLTITKSQSNASQNLQRFLMKPQSQHEKVNSTSSLMMVPIVSSYLPRPHSLTTPLKIPIPSDKLKNPRSAPVPILPKPNQNPNEHSPPIGRQGPTVDVKSIIADYQKAHPEQIPRRGRRLRGAAPDNVVTSSRGVLCMSSLALGSGSQVRTVGSTSGGDISYVMTNSQDTSRPSSADSNRSATTQGDAVSFKDVLVQFAKMSQHQQGDRRNGMPPSSSSSSSNQPSKPPPPYPEVTLHPVLSSGSQSPTHPSTSLLHGILTKSNGNSRGDNPRQTTFSPTLARLLTTPDRPPSTSTALRGNNTASTSASSHKSGTGPVSITDILSTSKNRNELTITPVVSTLQPAKFKEEHVSASQEEDAEDSADRLVIDESEELDTRGEEDELDSENVPECQGCHLKTAQFVCAGCGNQWYCSRDCQVSAWDEHSEVCSG